MNLMKYEYNIYIKTMKYCLAKLQSSQMNEEKYYAHGADTMQFQQKSQEVLFYKTDEQLPKFL